MRDRGIFSSVQEGLSVAGCLLLILTSGSSCSTSQCICGGLMPVIDQGGYHTTNFKFAFSSKDAQGRTDEDIFLLTEKKNI